MDELKKAHHELHRRIKWANNKLNNLEEKIASPANRSKNIKLFNKILEYKNDCHIHCRKIQISQKKEIKESEYDVLVLKCNVLIHNRLSLLKSYLSANQ